MLRASDLVKGGTLEDRYQLVQKLGESRLAVVWEVEDLLSNSDRKAIKVCKSHDFELVMLLRREFLTLQRLQQDSNQAQTKYIVQVEKLYPLKKPQKDDLIPLHFFVMEKITGSTLENLILKSLKANKESNLDSAKHGLDLVKKLGRSLYQLLFYRYPPLRSHISYSQIANWLEQLTQTLRYLHSQNIIYCDLKPANIMITDDGNIKLIDFGAAIITEDKDTYLRDVATRSATSGFTVGYVAPEQIHGQTLPQSDFYSLGQTLLFALTGLHPLEIQKSEKVQHKRKQPSNYWRSLFPSELSNFLIKAINDDPLKRHRDAEDLCKEGKSIARSLRYQFGKWAVLRQMTAVLSIAAIATASTLGLRSTGILQPFELLAYDQIVKMRPDQGTDPKILIIDIPRETQSISDQLLVDILSRLEKYDPKVIGIPLIRDQERQTTINSANKLQKIIEEQSNIFGVCVHTDTDRQRLSYPFLPKTDTPIGFENSHLDPDSSSRRQLMMYREIPKDLCPSNISFALLIAHQYLQIPSQDNVQMLNQTYHVGQAIFHSLEIGQGGYQDQAMTEFGNVFQIMIDYRSPNIAEVVPVSHLLESDLSLEKFRDRIVLIGRASINRDIPNIKTPYGSNYEISSIQITAQVISQLINTAEGRQSVLRPADFAIDFIWILSFSSLSAFIGWRINLRIYQAICIVTLLLFICLTYFYLFVYQGIWIGFIPITIASVVANLFVIAYTKYQYKLAGQI